jgi:hypothetical protein
MLQVYIRLFTDFVTKYMEISVNNEENMQGIKDFHISSHNLTIYGVIYTKCISFVLELKANFI